MKHRSLLGIVAIVAVLPFGCGPKGDSQGVGCTFFGGVTEYRLIRVRGCEYVSATSGSEGLAHAGDCDNPIHHPQPRKAFNPDSLTWPRP